MSGVVVVAPAEARWPSRAACVLSDAHMFIARLYEPSLLGLLVSSGDVRTIAIDTRIALRLGPRLHETLSRQLEVEVILVHEGNPTVTLGAWRSREWPQDPGAMLALVAAPRTGSA